MQFLIKSHEATLAPGKYPGSYSDEELLKNGLIVIDKPSGPTSHSIDAWIKQILSIDKCSHAGTLDPRVSGILIIALENATKLMPILLRSKKEYIALLHLHKLLPKDKIQEVCNRFIGKIRQTPPKKSAVAKRERTRQIYYLEILEIDGRDILMKVGCEAGTYIRKLCTDIGKELEVGAHMQELRRTRTGNFTEDDLITLQDLIDAKAENRLKDAVLPLEAVTRNMKSVIIKDSAIKNIVNGAPLAVQGISRIQEDISNREIVAMLSLHGQMVAFGPALMSSQEMFKKTSGLAVKTDRVLVKI